MRASELRSLCDHVETYSIHSVRCVACEAELERENVTLSDFIDAFVYDGWTMRPPEYQVPGPVCPMCHEVDKAIAATAAEEA